MMPSGRVTLSCSALTTLPSIKVVDPSGLRILPKAFTRLISATGSILMFKVGQGMGGRAFTGGLPPGDTGLTGAVMPGETGLTGGFTGCLTDGFAGGLTGGLTGAGLTGTTGGLTPGLVGGFTGGLVSTGFGRDTGGFAIAFFTVFLVCLRSRRILKAIFKSLYEHTLALIRHLLNQPT
ncbi:hypothetical protein EMIT0P260_140031 [Pseudomonas sp. IT-P260]